MNKIFKKLQYIDDLPNTKRKLITDIFFALLIFYVAAFAINLVDMPFIMIVLGNFIIKGIKYALTNSESISDITNQLHILTIPVWHTILSLFLFAIITMFVIIFRKYVDLGTCKSLGMNKKTFFKHYGLGLIIGALIFTITLGIDVLFGTAKNISASDVTVGNVIVIVVYLIGYAVQSMAEELLCRGFLLSNIARRYTPIKSIIFSSIFFTILHIGNPGYGLFELLSIFLFGILAAILVYYTGDIWLSCGLHCAWNFALTNIVKTSQLSILGSNDPAFFVIDVTTKSHFLQSISSIIVYALAIFFVVVIMKIQYNKEKKLNELSKESMETNVNEASENVEIESITEPSVNEESEKVEIESVTETSVKEEVSINNVVEENIN